MQSVTLKDSTVRKLLDGRTVAVRRRLNPQPERRYDGILGNEPSWYWRCRRLGAGYCHTREEPFIRLAEGVSPFGRIGERRWVREEWALENLDGDGERVVWRVDRAAAWRVSAAEVFYLDREYAPERWLPPSHMPRWASRLNVTVIDSRVEQLNGVWFWHAKLARAT